MTQPTYAANSLPTEVDLLDLPEPGSASTALADLTSSKALATITPRAEQARKINFTVAQVEANYAEKLANGSITKEQLAKITWLLTIGKTESYNLEQLSAKVGYDHSTTLYRVFHANYKAELRNVLDKIDAFRVLYEQRLGVRTVAFVETSLSRQIFDLCDLTRTYQCINPIYGNSQTGKSFALEEYRRLNNHGHTIYVAMPANGHLYKFLVALCKALGVSPKGNSLSLGERIVGALNENMLLIVDEIHQTCLTDGTIKLNTIEHIRLEIYEKVKCGIVLCGTNVFRKEMEQGKHLGVLEQTRLRGMTILQLPPLLPRDDMDALAAAFGLPSATDAIHELRVGIIKRHGLKAYTNFMRSGAKLALNRNEVTDWSHFVSAHDALAQLGAAK